MRFFNQTILNNLKRFNMNLLTLQMSEHSLASNQSSKTFETLKFDNLVLRSLPIDNITENYVREVKNACFSMVKKLIQRLIKIQINFLKYKVKPTPLDKPDMVVFSKMAMNLLDLDEKELQVIF